MTHSTLKLILPIAVVLATASAGSRGARVVEWRRATGTIDSDGAGHPAGRTGGHDLGLSSRPAAPILTQNARPDARPYLHPIAAPDGKGVLTEFSPEHHKHQTGLYWGFTRVNGRDYFHNPQGEYWRRVSATVTAASGDEVRWQTVYDLLDEAGTPS